MMNKREQTLSAIDDLDNAAFFKSDCTIIIRFGTNDNGERYVDAEMVTGIVNIHSPDLHNDLGDIIGAEDLAEALRMLAEKV